MPLTFHLWTWLVAVKVNCNKKLALSQSTRPSGFHYFSKSSIFEKYIGHRGLSVCLLSVCLSVCLSVFKGSTGHTDCPIVLLFVAEDVF